MMASNRNPCILDGDRQASWRILFTFTLICALGCLVYANTFNAPFLFDDTPNITRNPHIMIDAITPAAIQGVLAGPSASRPLAMLSFAANFFFNGYDPTGYHLVNLVIHLINAFLVFLLTAHTLRLCQLPSRTAPVFTALIWLVHPLHIQSVTYIVQRMTSLSTLFYLTALYCYIKGRRQMCAILRRPGITALWFLASVLAGLMSLLCKPIAGTLPLTIFLYELFFFHDLQSDWIGRRIKWIAMAVGLSLVVAVMYLDIIPLGRVLSTYHSQTFDMGQRVLTELRVIIYYLALTFFPFPARLTLDYDFPLSFSLLDPAVTALALTALCLLVVAAMISIKKQRFIAFAIIWFLITQAIESSLLGLDLIYEHRTYLPSVFPAMAIIFLVLEKLRPRAVTISIACLIIGISSLWTFQRNAVWRTQLSLWQDCVAKAPNKAGPRNNLGLAYINRGEYEKAVQQHSTALKIRRHQLGPNDPATAASYNNLGGAYRKLGDYAQAIACHEKALAMRKRILGPEHPQTAESYNNLGIAWKHAGNYMKAMENYRQALFINLKKLGPRHINTAVSYHNLKNVCASLETPTVPVICFTAEPAGRGQDAAHLKNPSSHNNPDVVRAGQEGDGPGIALSFSNNAPPKPPNDRHSPEQ